MPKKIVKIDINLSTYNGIFMAQYGILGLPWYSAERLQYLTCETDISSELEQSRDHRQLTLTRRHAQQRSTCHDVSASVDVSTCCKNQPADLKMRNNENTNNSLGV